VSDAIKGWVVRAHPKRGNGLEFVLGNVKVWLYPGHKLHDPVHGWDEPYPLGLMLYIEGEPSSWGAKVVRPVGPNVSKPPHGYIASFKTSNARWRAQDKIRREWPKILAAFPNLEVSIMEQFL
jgi:hypothetical protein